MKYLYQYFVNLFFGIGILYSTSLMIKKIQSYMEKKKEKEQQLNEILINLMVSSSNATWLLKRRKITFTMIMKEKMTDHRPYHG